MYVLYNLTNEFKTLNVDPNEDLELYNFIEETRKKGPRFSNYTLDRLEIFVKKINELRKNNTNNSTGQAL